MIPAQEIDHGTSRRKFIDSITLIADRQDAGTVTLESSDDDFLTFDSLGTFDLTLHDPVITRCGSYQGGRSYRLKHSYNGPCRMEAMEITYRVGV